MRKTLIAGFACLIPILITLYLFIFFVNLAAIPFLSVSRKILTIDVLEKIDFIEDHEFVQTLAAKCMAVIFLILLTYIVGFISRYSLTNHLIKNPLSLIRKFPLIGWLVSLTSQVSQKIFDPKNKHIFKETVLVPFFDPKRYSIGLVTSRKSPFFAKKIPAIDQVVFIPTSPHPVSGFLILTEKEALTLTKLDPEEALAFVISCGTTIE